MNADRDRRFTGLLLAGFFLARLVMLLSQPLEGLRGYGDLPNFFQAAALPGWPYLRYWSEFPPLFPFLSSLLYRLAGGQEHVYDYLLVLILTAADAGSLLIFTRLAARISRHNQLILRIAMYFGVLIVFPYSWWYFDPLAVFFFLAGLLLILEGKDLPAAIMVGLGVLTKFFPLLALVWAWRTWSPRRALRLTLSVLLPVLFIYGLLYAVSPDFTAASLRSQGSKGSWETVWALVDGNYQTGNFGPYSERFNPQTAAQPIGNPARIPPMFTLPIFAGLGLAAFLCSRGQGTGKAIALTGLAWCMLLLWSPGWSPQWCLYLLPLILLAFPLRLSALLSAVLVLINLLEWPVLLSRGLFSALPGPVLLRTGLLILLAGLYTQQLRQPESQQQGEE